jgi:pimeloyl-ACP methyl ester carboxylesterase
MHESVDVAGHRHRVLSRVPAGARASALLLHGANTHAGVFAGVLDACPPELALHAVDFPGRGLAEALQLETIAARVAFARAVIGALGLERPIVVGHSLGGAVALELAAQAPELVGGLVVCAAGTQFAVPTAQLAELQQLAAAGGRRTPSAASFSPQTGPEILAAAAAIYAAVPAGTALVDYRCLVDWNGDAASRAVTARTVIIRGSDEYLLLRAQCDALVDRMRATSVVVPAAGHMLPLEQPHALGAAITSLA